MAILVAIFFALVSIAFGLVCIRSPMAVLRSMARWTRFVSTRLLPGVKVRSALREAFDLVDSPSTKPPERFRGTVAMIRFTGVVALLVAAGAGCIIVLTITQS